jgi:hypothetical protein
LPFSSFAFARSALNKPNPNLVACFVVVSFYFVSFSSSDLIGFGIRCYKRITSTSSHRPIALTRPIGRPLTSATHENRGKKSGCLGRKQWEKCFFGGGGREGGREREEGGEGGEGEGGSGARGGGRTCVRACVHAPFDLPPIA